VGVGVGVGVDEAAGERRPEGGGAVRGEGALPGDPVGQRLAGDQLHDEERAPFVLAGRVDADDVLVLEPGEEPRLAPEPLEGGRAGVPPGAQELEGHLAPGRVARPVDDAHAAARQLPLDLVGADPHPASVPGRAGPRRSGAPGRAAGAVAPGAAAGQDRSMSEPDPLVGRTIDGCRLAQRLAVGARSVVYEAVDPGSGERFAIKALAPERAGEGDAPATRTRVRSRPTSGRSSARPDGRPAGGPRSTGRRGILPGHTRGGATVVEESRLVEQEGGGLRAEGPGWFVLNVGQASWVKRDPFSRSARLEGTERFPHVGIHVDVLDPGEPNCRYHREDAQENFLVLSGECLLLIEEQERRLSAWDFVHMPPGTDHVLVGAGDGPCAVLAIGARLPEERIVYPRSELALKHGAGVETETDRPREAYADVAGKGEVVQQEWPLA